MTNKEVEKIREYYIDILQPLFLPKDPISNDIIKYFASLLRIVGIEDQGWDPYLESRNILEDLNSILLFDDSDKIFQNKEPAIWRMGLLMYSHIVEMDAPYEVITNLLRFRLGKGYSPNPYYLFLNSKEKKNFKRSGIHPYKKIEIIKKLSEEANLPVGSLFDEFYNSKLRNAISHADYILTKKEFRVRNGTGAIGAYKIDLEELNIIITKAKLFISTFFALERETRRYWGQRKHKAIPYDPVYKGLMEILVDDDDLMCGFKVHWPNNSESVYRRTKDGIDMCNCSLAIKDATISLFVNLYARKPGTFSPLVEEGVNPVYTKIEGTNEVPKWNPN